MKKKYFMIAVIILLTIISAITVVKVITDLKKETKIKNEVQKIIEILESDTIDKTELIDILDRRVVTKGNYVEVENSIKLYYKDLYDDISNLTFLINEDNYSNYLTSANLKEDRPNFIKSKDNLQNTEAQINEVYTELTNQLTDKSIIMSYIIDKDVKTYYKDFYYTLVKDYISENWQEDLSSKKNITLKIIQTYNEALDFLVANKGHWKLNNDLITFDDTTLYEEYLLITGKLKEASDN